MRSRGCRVWKKYQSPTDEGKSRLTEEEEKKQKEEANDRLVEKIMADAEIAKNKRDIFCEQARSRS
jgi:hypothetical protein